MTLSKKTFGDLPPNSSVTGMMFSDAYCIMRRPVDVSPVKPTFLIPGCVASGLPTSAPDPLTTLTVPGSRMSAINSMTRRIPTGVWLAALMTTQLPAARAGAIFQAAIRMGKFQGMICPTTPSGSWK